MKRYRRGRTFVLVHIFLKTVVQHICLAIGSVSCEWRYICQRPMESWKWGVFARKEEQSYGRSTAEPTLVHLMRLLTQGVPYPLEKHSKRTPDLHNQTGWLANSNLKYAYFM